MFRWFEGRRSSALILAASLGLALPGDVRGQAWELEREKGVGGGPAPASPQAAVPQKKIGVKITVDGADQPVIRTAKGAPVDKFDSGNDQTKLDAAKALVAARSIIASPDESDIETPAEADAVTDTRSVPPTAAELLDGSRAKPIETKEIAALPSAHEVPRPLARPQDLANTIDEVPSAVEQAQHSPNAAAELEQISPVDMTTSSTLPSPRKSLVTQAALQQGPPATSAVESSKDTVLQTAPDSDDEVVDTPVDYTLAVPAGSGRLLNLGKAITDVVIADPSIADVKVVSPTQLFAHGNMHGRTNVFGLGADGNVVFAVDVNVMSNVEVAETQEPKVDNTTSAGSQQIDIQVRFAEVSRSDMLNLGINWDAVDDTGDFLFGLASDPEQLTKTEALGSAVGDAKLVDVNVDTSVDALQRNGIINLLAEPNLTATNGETATFLAGGEIPIPAPGEAGDGTVTIEYKPFSVSLDFIPTLLPGERINFRVRPEVSSINAEGGGVLDGFSIPGFTVRNAETNVELVGGQTIAIAGLFQGDLATDIDKFPVLSEVPVLGQLLQSERFRRYETELVVLITPYLTNPTSIASPDDRLDDPAKPLASKTTKVRKAGYVAN